MKATRNAPTIPLANRTSLAIAALAAASLALIGCAPTGEPAPTPTDASEPGATAEPGPTIPPVGDDATLAVDTVATEPGGASLALSLRVAASLPADDAAASELRSLLTEACGPDFVNDDALDGDSWGLVRIDVIAQQLGDAAWPAEVPVPMLAGPRGEAGAAATTGSGAPLATPEDPAGESGPCLLPPQVTGAGEAYQVLGIRYDFASADAQGVFWNGYRYGFDSLSFGQETGIVFSECTIRKTELGEQLAAPEIGYEESTDAAECSAGIPDAA